MRIMWLIIIFLIIGGFMITRSYNLNLKESEDRRTFIGKFSIWLFNIGKNVVRTVGYVVNMDWLPETNKTNETKLINYTNYVIKD